MIISGHNESGETLLEILIAIVVIGLVISGYFSAFSTASTVSGTHRDVATADGLLRDAAELTKNTVRASCSTGSTYSVDYSSLVTSPVTHPGFIPPAAIVNQGCPPVTGSAATQVPTVSLTFTLPHGQTRTLSVMVRTP